MAKFCRSLRSLRLQSSASSFSRSYHCERSPCSNVRSIPSPSPRSSSSPPSSCCSSSSSSSSVTVVLPSLRPSSFLHSATISPPPSSSSSPSCSSSSSPYSPAVTTSSLSCHGRASLQKLHSRRHHLHHPILNSSSSFSRRSNTVFLPWSSFIFSSRSFSFIVHCRGLGQKPRAPYSFLSVRADLGGQYDDNFADVDKVLLICN